MMLFLAGCGHVLSMFVSINIGYCRFITFIKLLLIKLSFTSVLQTRSANIQELYTSSLTGSSVTLLTLNIVVNVCGKPQWISLKPK